MIQARDVRDATRSLLLAHDSFDTVRRPCGAEMSRPHAYALMQLQRRGPMTVSALAAYLHIDRTNVSRLCARMERTGQVARHTDPTDRRARVVQLTALGERAAQQVDVSSMVHFQTITATLSAAELSVVLRGLELLRAAMTGVSESTTSLEDEHQPPRSSRA